MKGTTRQTDATIGLDLGDKCSQAVVLDASGEEIEERPPVRVGGADAA